MPTTPPKPRGWRQRWHGWVDGAGRAQLMAIVLATTAPGVPEIFASLQGEGPNAGVPVAFIRLSRCNLSCVWCDTPYTWHFNGDNRPHNYERTWDRKFNQVTLELQEVADLIRALDKTRLVVTGGEPLLQGRDVAALALLLPGMAIEIETNGSVRPHPLLDQMVDQYNVSPKLAHSGNPAELALRADMLQHWAQEPRATFKFVVAEPAHVDEVKELVAQHGVLPDKVILMPEGIDSATLHERMLWLAPLCMETGFRLGDRMHIHLFGDTRGT